MRVYKDLNNILYLYMVILTNTDVSHAEQNYRDAEIAEKQANHIVNERKKEFEEALNTYNLADEEYGSFASVLIVRSATTVAANDAYMAAVLKAEEAAEKKTAAENAEHAAAKLAEAAIATEKAACLDANEKLNYSDQAYKEYMAAKEALISAEEHKEYKRAKKEALYEAYQFALASQIRAEEAAERAAEEAATREAAEAVERAVMEEMERASAESTERAAKVAAEHEAAERAEAEKIAAEYAIEQAIKHEAVERAAAELAIQQAADRAAEHAEERAKLHKAALDAAPPAPLVDWKCAPKSAPKKKADECILS